MSSTEQKNVVQPFINHCFTFGILPTITCGAFDDFPLDTERAPFADLGSTPNLGRRLRASTDPISEARRILPVLSTASATSRAAPFLLGLCHNNRVLYGNQAVLYMCEAIVNLRGGLHVTETGAYKQAKNNAKQVYAMFAPANYSKIERTKRNARRLFYDKESARLRVASDAIDNIARGLKTHRAAGIIRSWCASNRDNYGYEAAYRRDAKATEAFHAIDKEKWREIDLPAPLKQKFIRCSTKSGCSVAVYKYGSTTYIRLTRTKFWGAFTKESRTPVVLAFSFRDLDDLRFLLHSCSLIRQYHQRRCSEGKDALIRDKFRISADTMWSSYLEVMRTCSHHFDLRNKLGVYFDVLQWRYLAWKSGDEFYNHSSIMAKKIETKDLTRLPDQGYVLGHLKSIHMDMAIDLLGMYKASIYPEVDPFKVVADQYQLHMSRFDTNWPEDSPEHDRFMLTQSYMWYLGSRVIKKRFGIWPGKIRDGAITKHWHAKYNLRGIPGDCWRDAHDIDLSGVWPAAGITNEQYFRQQDSACAPPLWQEYQSYEAMQHAPKRHRRKLLYAIQEPSLPDLPDAMAELDRLGRQLPELYVDELDCSLPFSTDIVTGSRCERHKDAPRPFYAASPPWGCILSHIDGITRDFLSHVPQGMLGKSTRQKFIDISSLSKTEHADAEAFYMSDDKAKYSPKMDPRSQQLPADFFAELFDQPGIKACGPIMYHNELYYRVCGHLVHYNSNGTDREGMRGASNTWLEIVAQGLATRLCREKKISVGKSHFLSFIDDGLRKFFIPISGRADYKVVEDARTVIEEVIFGLKVLGRELSWDKTFVSRKLFVILNEIMYDESHFSSGLKSFCTTGDIDVKEIMSAADYEQLYFGKLRGAHSVGTPIDLAHSTYIFETMISHYKMGLNLQDNSEMNRFEYRLYCLTPISLGGAGLRSMSQMCSTEVANSLKEGLGNLFRLGKVNSVLGVCTEQIILQPTERIASTDYAREPEQAHVAGPRIRTQRLPAEIRKYLHNVVSNDIGRRYLEQDNEGLEYLDSLGNVMRQLPKVSAESLRLTYSSSPAAFIDEFIQKLSSSTTISAFLSRESLSMIRRLVRLDLLRSAQYFRWRCSSRVVLDEIKKSFEMYSYISYFVV